MMIFSTVLFVLMTVVPVLSSSYTETVQSKREYGINGNIMKLRLYSFDPPLTPLLYGKTGVYRGTHYFSYFC